ncbi:hypothetical protein KR222_000933, partial [Zaprionus bogoriensis]
QINSKNYYFVDKEMSWTEAKDTCSELGGYLVTFQNQGEFDEVVKYLRPNVHYWIGANDVQTLRQYRPIDDSLGGGYFRWHKDEPSSHHDNEHCVELKFFDNMHLMNNVRCDFKFESICELQ